MEVLDNKSDSELLQSLLAEVAKATNELRCAQGDIDKTQNRLSFALLLTNALLNRSKE